MITLDYLSHDAIEAIVRWLKITDIAVLFTTFNKNICSHLEHIPLEITQSTTLSMSLKTRAALMLAFGRLKVIHYFPHAALENKINGVPPIHWLHIINPNHLVELRCKHLGDRKTVEGQRILMGCVSSHWPALRRLCVEHLDYTCFRLWFPSQSFDVMFPSLDTVEIAYLSDPSFLGLLPETLTRLKVHLGENNLDNTKLNGILSRSKQLTWLETTAIFGQFEPLVFPDNTTHLSLQISNSHSIHDQTTIFQTKPHGVLIDKFPKQLLSLQLRITNSKTNLWGHIHCSICNHFTNSIPYAQIEHFDITYEPVNHKIDNLLKFPNLRSTEFRSRCQLPTCLPFDIQTIPSSLTSLTLEAQAVEGDSVPIGNFPPTLKHLHIRLIKYWLRKNAVLHQSLWNAATPYIPENHSLPPELESLILKGVMIHCKAISSLPLSLKYIKARLMCGTDKHIWEMVTRIGVNCRYRLGMAWFTGYLLPPTGLTHVSSINIMQEYNKKFAVYSLNIIFVLMERLENLLNWSQDLQILDMTQSFEEAQIYENMPIRFHFDWIWSHNQLLWLFERSKKVKVLHTDSPTQVLSQSDLWTFPMSLTDMSVGKLSYDVKYFPPNLKKLRVEGEVDLDQLTSWKEVLPTDLEVFSLPSTPLSHKDAVNSLPTNKIIVEFIANEWFDFQASRRPPLWILSIHSKVIITGNMLPFGVSNVDSQTLINSAKITIQSPFKVFVDAFIDGELTRTHYTLPLNELNAPSNINRKPFRIVSKYQLEVVFRTTVKLPNSTRDISFSVTSNNSESCNVLTNWIPMKCLPTSYSESLVNVTLNLDPNASIDLRQGIFFPPQMESLVVRGVCNSVGHIFEYVPGTPPPFFKGPLRRLIVENPLQIVELPSFQHPLSLHWIFGNPLLEVLKLPHFKLDPCWIQRLPPRIQILQLSHIDWDSRDVLALLAHLKIIHHVEITGNPIVFSPADQHICSELSREQIEDMLRQTFPCVECYWQVGNYSFHSHPHVPKSE